METEVRASRLPDATVTFRPLELSDAELEAYARLPGVAAVEARSAFPTRIYVGERRADALVVGVRDFGRQRVDVVTVASGRAPTAGGVLTEVQNGRTGKLSVGAGDIMKLNADGKKRTMRVSGEGRNLNGGREVLDEGTIVIYASNETVTELSGAHGYRRLSARADRAGPKAAVAALRAQLAQRTGFTGFADLPALRARGDWPGKAELGAFTDLLSIVTLLALATALVLISNTMTTLVGEQTGEIATMKAIGARRRDIAAIYLRTALLLGALGTAVGVALGVMLANALAAFFGSAFFGVDPAFGVHAPVLVWSVVLGIAGPPLAALPAIRRGVRLPVAERCPRPRRSAGRDVSTRCCAAPPSSRGRPRSACARRRAASAAASRPWSGCARRRHAAGADRARHRCQPDRAELLERSRMERLARLRARTRRVCGAADPRDARRRRRRTGARQRGQGRRARGQPVGCAGAHRLRYRIAEGRWYTPRRNAPRAGHGRRGQPRPRGRHPRRGTRAGRDRRRPGVAAGDRPLGQPAGGRHGAVRASRRCANSCGRRAVCATTGLSPGRKIGA